MEKIILSKKYKLIPTEDQREYFNLILALKGSVHNAILTTYTIMNPFLDTFEISTYMRDKYISSDDVFDHLQQIGTQIITEKYTNQFNSNNQHRSNDLAKDLISYIHGNIKQVFNTTRTKLKPKAKEFVDGVLEEDHFLLTIRKFYSLTLNNVIKHKLALASAKPLFEKYEPKLVYIQSQIRQSFVEDFHTTMERHFKVSVGGKNVGFPKYVGGKHKIQTATLIKQNFIAMINPKDGMLKVPQSRDKILDSNEVKLINWDDDWIKHKMARTLIHKDSNGDFYIIVPYEVECFDINHAKDKVGIDPGIATMLTLYDGEEFYEIQPPKRILKYMSKLQKISTALSKKIRGSKRYGLLLKKLNKVYQKLSNIRNDFNHKVTKRSVTTYKIINFETADVNGWKTNNKSERNSTLQNLINLGQFGDFLKYKTQKYTSTFVHVSGYEKATRTCSNCNADNGKLDVNIRDFVCISCGLTISRDRNAAINIYNH